MKGRTMKSDWTPVSEAQPHRSGPWLVTRDDYVDQCHYKHPNESVGINDRDDRLGPGWYDRHFARVTDVVAWRPLVFPFVSGDVPARRLKPARLGDRVGTARVEADGKPLIELVISGGDRLDDSLHVDSVRRAVDGLFEALLPDYFDAVKIRLFKQE